MVTSPFCDYSVTILWRHLVTFLWLFCDFMKFKIYEIINLFYWIPAAVRGPGDQNTKFRILKQDWEVIVTRWPKQKKLNFTKHKILNFTTRLQSYGHKVTKTQNFEFYNKIGKFWSPGDQNKKNWILQQNREIIVTRWPKHKIFNFTTRLQSYGHQVQL